MTPAKLQSSTTQTQEVLELLLQILPSTYRFVGPDRPFREFTYFRTATYLLWEQLGKVQNANAVNDTTHHAIHEAALCLENVVRPNVVPPKLQNVSRSSDITLTALLRENVLILWMQITSLHCVCSLSSNDIGKCFYSKLGNQTVEDPARASGLPEALRRRLSDLVCRD